MSAVTAGLFALSILVFIYLGVALLRAERF